MRKFLFSLLLVVFCMPTIAHADKRQQFIKFMEPKIELANQQILAVRKQLIYLHYLWQQDRKLSELQQQWLDKLAHDYRVKQVDFAHAETWNTLMRRVDGLPDSLVLAQAIVESAWGSSYFAERGKNYFGIWCTRPGCGMIPRRRPAGATYEVRKYSSTLAAVKSYFRIINTQRAYRKLRSLRQQLRINQQILTGIILAEGLEHYSQRGKQYVKILHSIINKYQLSQYDQE